MILSACTCTLTVNEIAIHSADNQRILPLRVAERKSWQGEEMFDFLYHTLDS